MYEIHKKYLVKAHKLTYNNFDIHIYVGHHLTNAVLLFCNVN
jgi:hypothetical protein